MMDQSMQTQLRAHFDLAKDRVAIDDCRLVVENNWFESRAATLLAGAKTYACEEHGLRFSDMPSADGVFIDEPHLTITDADVSENRRFRFATYRDARQVASRGVIIVLHGLNERDWAKYLPWAAALAQKTGKAVVLFPLAFHMNRAPAAWGNPRLMLRVSEARRARSSAIANSTFANAAISSRLQAHPERFCWSGLQTIYDLSQFVKQLRTGQYPSLAPDSTVDVFAYSIGAFLAEILLMADPEGLFNSSRLFMFCGGATLDRFYPNCRYILDSDATIALYSYFQARFENELQKNERLCHYVQGPHKVGHFFRAMLDYREGKVVRESRLSDLGGRISAVALKRDKVAPPSEVMNTLQGDYRDIPIEVMVRDFPYEYNHALPFPSQSKNAEAARCFAETFERASAFLG
jgi:hypothetical protein